MAAVAMAALAAAGCVQVQPPGPVDVEPVATGDVQRVAVVLGLTAVNPDRYGGWNGACPGCDVDADVFGLLCRERGLRTTILHNEQATSTALALAASDAYSTMRAGDLLVLFVSGHGGQVQDTNGDEADGQDETLCLWDGQLTDDLLAQMWARIPAGVRVLFITDTCNSGTNYRRRSIRRTVPRAYAGQLIHFGGCADGESSFGSPQGGTFTTALIDAWSADQSVLRWFEAARQRMPRSQVPAYAEFGEVSDAFRHGRALE